MGASFTPCYANIDMGLWEEYFPWNSNSFIRHIIYYGRCIDYVPLIWDGDEDLFLSFIAHCNSNNLGLSFAHLIDPAHLVFLDLELLHDAGSIITRNHSKLVVGNSYLHHNSCHHPALKNIIPTGQFLRLKNNCSKCQDYILQSQVPMDKFMEKGYPKDLLLEASSLV